MSDPMSSTEIDETIIHVVADIQRIAFWRIKMRRLKEELEKQEFTEDDAIISDLLDFSRNALGEQLPLSRVYPLNGKTIKITLAHRHKAERIYGIDLVYEILDDKMALLQYKKIHNDRFYIDRTQLNKLRFFCYDDCIAKEYEKTHWFSENFRMISFCPCFYNLIIEPEEELIIPACIVQAILDSKKEGRQSASVKEFHRGMSQDAFMEIFSKCWLGGLHSKKAHVDEMIQFLFSKNHLIFLCQEQYPSRAR